MGKLKHVGGRGDRIYYCVNSIPAHSLLAQDLMEAALAAVS